MSSRVVALSEIAPELLLEFLGRTGMSREVAQWRYLDPAFNRGHNRGFVWLPAERIQGMVGLIPFRIGDGSSTREANWSCDWMLADPSSNPGMGIILLKRAIQGSGTLFALGGNVTTQRLMPRIATRTQPDAGITLHLLLRSGAILRRLERRTQIRLPIPGALYKIPLRPMPGRRTAIGVRTERGVARSIGHVIEAGVGQNHWSPRYDFEYIDWQIGRSPVLTSWTSYGPAGEEPKAAALWWHPRASSDFWRLALWSAPESAEILDAVLREALLNISGSGGMAVSTLVSHLDRERLALLRSTGFVARGRRALYECTGGHASPPVAELGGLSYLDTDLAYRF